MIDPVTQRWIRNRSDEQAVDAGCWFDEERGRHVLTFAEKYLRLYEGDKAGQSLTPMPWQEEVVMRLFGWVRPSERWGCDIRRFNRASIWIPKKNGKSPSLAWWGLYLLCADGEMGQKVYFGAKDGQQAREIAGKHALEMVLSSPKLLAECEINRSLMQITHRPTRSILKPMSSGDSRNQKSKEGINGSVLIDETHVVDRAFVNRISRAGISRKEPLQIEVSTAGSDPEGYGREQYDYGKRVESGEQQDERFFFCAYEMPQDVTDAQLAEDPVKYGRAANPAWGFTVGEEEYLDDYRRSRTSLSQLAEFKMYRGNVWQASANPWLNMQDWAKNRREYTEEDLLGKVCYGGLDLAKTRDTCALVLVFPQEDGSYRQLAYFWLPRRRAEILADKVRYLEWASVKSDGSHLSPLTLTDGDTTDYNFIRAALIEAKEKFELAKLAYDDTYANQMVQRLIEEDGAFTEEEVCPFKQTIMEFAGPTDQYEGLLIDGKLHHNGHPLFTWQAGNVKVKTDVNHNKRPVKQQHGDSRTIDGLVAGIMALGLALDVAEMDWYSPGCLTN